MSFDAHLLSLQTLFDPELAEGFETALELRLDDQPFRAVVSGGELSLERGEVSEPDAVITSDAGTMLAVAHGREAARLGRPRHRGRPRGRRALLRAVPAARARGLTRVELLWWEGCPSHPQALEDLRRDDGGGRARPASRSRSARSTPRTPAERERFVGSPTIRVDGEDIAPVEGELTGLACRVYRLRDGRPSPVPDTEDVRAALRRHRDHST